MTQDDLRDELRALERGGWECLACGDWLRFAEQANQWQVICHELKIQRPNPWVILRVLGWFRTSPTANADLSNLVRQLKQGGRAVERNGGSGRAPTGARGKRG